MNKKMQILIAHHQEKVCSALTFLLSQEPNMQVVGSASCLEELKNILKSTHTDVILLDCDLSGKAFEEQIAKVQEYAGNLKIVVLCSSTKTKQAMLPAGDLAFVDITEHPKRLITALRILELEGQYE